MPESPTASALRTVERDLVWSLAALRDLTELVEEAASHVAASQPELARRLRSRAGSIAYGRMRGEQPLFDAALPPSQLQWSVER
ncbi:MAG: hypothetical protein V7607_5608 [Solirubrobacteraceae bacterium]